MKIIKFTLSAIIVLCVNAIVTSCKKTASTSPDTPAVTAPVSVGANITGTWYWTDLKDSLTIGASAGTIQTFTIPAAQGITFNSTGTYTSDRNFSQIGNPNNLSVDNGNYTNADSLIITSVVISSPTRSPVRAKILSATTTNLTFVYKTGTKFHTCYFTKQ